MKTLAQLAAELRMAEAQLQYAALLIATECELVSIPKPRTDRQRLLVVPPFQLRVLLRKVSKALMRDLAVHPAVKSFRYGVHVHDAALPHQGCRTLVRVDIHDFFMQISRMMVLETLLYAYTLDAASLLSTLCTHVADRHYFCLPQGFPTSPALSNAALWQLDKQLAALGWIYTRFADDMFFSTTSREDGCELLAEVLFLLHSFFGFGCENLISNTEITQAKYTTCKVLGYNVSPGAVRAPRRLWQRLRFLLTRAKRGDQTARAEAEGLVEFLSIAEPRKAEQYKEALCACA